MSDKPPTYEYCLVCHRANQKLSEDKICVDCLRMMDKHAKRPDETSVKVELSFDKAVKADAGKNPLDLLPFEALEQVGLVLDFGARKYAAHNWRHGMKWSRLLGAALRHLFAWGRGIKADPETGLSHLAHASCCILFLLSYEQTGGGEDDRWTK